MGRRRRFPLRSNRPRTCARGASGCIATSTIPTARSRCRLETLGQGRSRASPCMRPDALPMTCQSRMSRENTTGITVNLLITILVLHKRRSREKILIGLCGYLRFRAPDPSLCCQITKYLFLLEKPRTLSCGNAEYFSETNKYLVIYEARDATPAHGSFGISIVSRKLVQVGKRPDDSKGGHRPRI